jgi:hypothetical protein
LHLTADGWVEFISIWEARYISTYQYSTLYYHILSIMLLWDYT